MSQNKPPPPPPIEDTELWLYVTKDVSPLHKKVVEPNEAANFKSTHPLPNLPKPPPTLPHEANIKAKPLLNTSQSSTEIDRSTKTKFERGQMSIEAILDLHGHTYESAQESLTSFLMQHSHAGTRHVLVITGKGKGILRAGFEMWVKQAPLNQIILSVAAAKGKHGGNGAFYVLLRRRR